MDIFKWETLEGQIAQIEVTIKEKDLKSLEAFIEIIIGILETLEKKDPQTGKRVYYYAENQEVDIYDKREQVKQLSGFYPFETQFHNFTQNIITKSIMHRFNFNDYHNLKKEFNQFIVNF